MASARHPPKDSEPPRSASSGQGEATHSEDGVDLTLIRWMLRLTPTERLQAAQEMVDTVEALRRSREP